MNIHTQINKDQPIMKEIGILLLFILTGIIGRTILVGAGVQPFPNFEIIMVLTFLATLFIRPSYAFLVPLLSMIGSDLLIGNPIFIGNQMNKIILFTYTGFLIITLLSTKIKKQSKHKLGTITATNITSIIGLGVGFVLLYDLWTNFGWWFLMYPPTFETLITVYLAGIPFMIYHILSAAITFTLIAIPIGYLLTNKQKLSFEFKKTSWEIIPVITITLLFVFLSFSGAAMQLPQQSEIWLESSDETSVHITIQGSNWMLKDNVCIIESETSVYQLLKTMTKRHHLTLNSTYYETFNSVLIESIQTDTNGYNDYYWQYYVNDEIPMVGCDSYYVENGDSILWRFEQLPS